MQTISLKHPDRFFINGVWTPPSSDATVEVLSSSTEELFVRVAEAMDAMGII